MRLGVRDALVDGALVSGDVLIDESGVVAVGAGRGGRGPGSGTALPGFIDAHINGVVGVDFLSTDADGYREAGAALARTGVTGYVPTFISSPLDDYGPALDVAAAAMAHGPPAAPI